MSATRSARVATSRSWPRVFSSWVPKMAGWCTLSRASVGHAAQFSAYLRSMLRHCLLLIGALPVATAPAAGQHADTLRNRLEARIARAPAQAVGVYYRSLVRPDSVLIGANLRLHAASTMKVPVMIQIFRDADAALLGLGDSLTVHTAFPSLVPGAAFTVAKEDDSDSTLYALVGRNRSVRDLLERMITRSSNLATNILIERVGAARAQASARAPGAWSIQVLRGVEDGAAYRAGPNHTTTAPDLDVLLEAIAIGLALPRAGGSTPVSPFALHPVLPSALHAGTLLVLRCRVPLLSAPRPCVQTPAREGD